MFSRMRTLLAIVALSVTSDLAAQHKMSPVRPASKLTGTSVIDWQQRLLSTFSEGTAHPLGVDNCTDLLAKGKPAVLAGVNGPDSQAMKSTLA